MTENNPQQPAATPPLSYQAPADSVDKDARLWGMLCHLAALAGFIIPFGNIIGPLVVWQIKKEIPFANDQGKEALNFQITVAIALVICFVLIFVLIGFILLPIVALSNLVFIIIAAVKANNGVVYRYPVNIRFIK